MDSKQIEATPKMTAIEGKTKDPQYLNSLEKERNTLKQVYYMWLARCFVALATLSMMFFVLASLSLFHLAPAVTVDPLLLVNQNDSMDAIRSEAIAPNMASKDQLFDMYVRQYVILRNTIINDPVEMRSRWMSGGIVNYLSSPQVYENFGDSTKKMWEEIFKKVMVREVEIISVTRQGGARSSVWKVDFKTYDLYNEQGKTQSQQETTLRVRYWTASITAHFIPERAFMAMRLINPLGFTVTRYSQTEVEIF